MVEHYSTRTKPLFIYSNAIPFCILQYYILILWRVVPAIFPVHVKYYWKSTPATGRETKT